MNFNRQLFKEAFKAGYLKALRESRQNQDCEIITRLEFELKNELKKYQPDVIFPWQEISRPDFHYYSRVIFTDPFSKKPFTASKFGGKDAHVKDLKDGLKKALIDDLLNRYPDWRPEKQNDEKEKVRITNYDDYFKKLIVALFNEARKLETHPNDKYPNKKTVYVLAVFDKGLIGNEKIFSMRKFGLFDGQAKKEEPKQKTFGFYEDDDAWLGEGSTEK